MAHYLNRRLLTAEAAVRPQVSLCGICGGKLSLQYILLSCVIYCLSESFNQYPALIIHVSTPSVI